MKRLRNTFQGMGCSDVASYIQSGNIVFRYPKEAPHRIEKKITSAIYEEFEISPAVLVLEAFQFNTAIAKNPFPGSDDNPKSLHLFFFSNTPHSPDITGMEKLKTSTEQLRIEDRVLYLFAPDGIGKSKLASRIEKLAGVTATARNWRTVTKIADLLNGQKS